MIIRTLIGGCGLALLAACGESSVEIVDQPCPNGVTPSGTPVATTDGMPVRCGPQVQAPQPTVNTDLNTAVVIQDAS